MFDRSKKLPRMFRSIRARVLLGCVLLMTFSALSSTIFIRQLLYVHLEERIEKELQRSAGEFAKHAQARNPEINQFSPEYLTTLFNSFVSREVIQDKYYIMLTNGQINQTSERKLANNFHFNPAQLIQLSKISSKEVGEIEIHPSSIIYYYATPVKLASGQNSVFIVVYDATGECEEINQAMMIIIEVTLGVLLISLIAAWIDTKRILHPLQLLTNTAQKITDIELSNERLPLVGYWEIADLTNTFNEMLDRLQTSFNTQKEFLNHAGHELRTPLTIIRVNLELMSNEPEERSKTIAIVTDELDRMSRYVNEMILLAKAEQPNFLMLETVNLESLTKEIYTKATALGDRQWQLEKVGKGKIVCDRHRMTQVLMNLLQNAAQQTHRGDSILIGSTIQNGMARFWVRDTGPGIDPRVHQIIFDRFIRCPDARKRFEGMGLGLAIVKAIVEAHGGNVKLVSKMDLGSKFTVSIPIDPPREDFG